MKKLLLCICLPLLLAACGSAPPETGTPVTVYGLGEKDNEVLVKYTLYCPEGTPLWRFALDSVLEAENSRSDFSALLAVTNAFLEDGVAKVTLSEPAAALTGLPLTLVRAGVVLTLTGLEGIDGVTLQTEGHGEDQTVWKASDFVLDSLVVSGTERNITLYFSDMAGEQVLSEARTLVVLETDTIDWYIRYTIDELIAGPKTTGRYPVMPEGTKLLSVIVEGGGCTVNFSGEFTQCPDEASALMMLSCLIRSVTEQPGVVSLSLLVEGQPCGEYFSLDISKPLSASECPWIIP